MVGTNDDFHIFRVRPVLQFAFGKMKPITTPAWKGDKPSGTRPRQHAFGIKQSEEAIPAKDEAGTAEARSCETGE